MIKKAAIAATIATASIALAPAANASPNYHRPHPHPNPLPAIVIVSDPVPPPKMPPLPANTPPALRKVLNGVDHFIQSLPPAPNYRIKVIPSKPPVKKPTDPQPKTQVKPKPQNPKQATNVKAGSKTSNNL